MTECVMFRAMIEETVQNGCHVIERSMEIMNR
jgi:hypothetical protein